MKTQANLFDTYSNTLLTLACCQCCGSMRRCHMHTAPRVWSIHDPLPLRDRKHKRREKNTTRVSETGDAGRVCVRNGTLMRILEDSHCVMTTTWVRLASRTKTASQSKREGLKSPDSLRAPYFPRRPRCQASSLAEDSRGQTAFDKDGAEQHF